MTGRRWTGSTPCAAASASPGVSLRGLSEAGESGAAAAAEFLALPYARRRRIVIADEPDAARRAALPAWVDLAAAAVPAGGAAVHAYRAVQSFRTAGFDALAVSPALADGLGFPPGHPREKVVYVANPVDPTAYYPAADFHRLAFEHKLAEAIRLLMALGATEIEVEHRSGWTREFAGQLDISLPKGPATGSATGGQAHAGTTLFSARMDAGGAPHVPDDLAWYPHEPAWQQLAAGRLEHGLREFELLLRYDDDFGVNAALAAAAERAGLTAGGRFEQHRATAWRIAGRFGG